MQQETAPWFCQKPDFFFLIVIWEEVREYWNKEFMVSRSSEIVFKYNSQDKIENSC